MHSLPAALVLSVIIALASGLLHSSNTHAATNAHLLHHHGSTLKVHLNSEFTPDMQHKLLKWADHISRSLLQVYGRWPRQNWEIFVSPVSASGSNPIPWAQVKRGNPDRVEFFTSAATSTEQLAGAWTSYHELSHLLIPYRGWGDIWFSEGLATYYQNVLQARIGQISEQEMWQKLYNGFMRGRAQSEFSHYDLQSLSTNMRSQGAYMRVYWSGAWYFLNADLKLRQQSGGIHNLDWALERLNRCCANQKLSVPQMVKKLDEINNLNLFAPLYSTLITSTDTPAFEPLFASLGICVVNHKVQLQAMGPDAKLRSQISQRKVL